MSMTPQKLPKVLTDCTLSNEDALKKVVKSGRSVMAGFATSEPVTFYSTVWDHIRKEKLREIKIVNGLVLTPYKLFVGSALSRKGLLAGVADNVSVSLFAEWARAINQATRKFDSLASLIAHYKRLQSRKIVFKCGFLSPVVNGIIPDTKMSRMLYPDYIGRNTSRMGITDMLFVHFPDAADSMGMDDHGGSKTDLIALVMTPPNADGEMSHGPSSAMNGAPAGAHLRGVRPGRAAVRESRSPVHPRVQRGGQHDPRGPLQEAGRRRLRFCPARRQSRPVLESGDGEEATRPEA